MSELADERVALSEAQSTLADKQAKLDTQAKVNQELKRTAERVGHQIKQVEENLKASKLELKEF